MTYAFTATTVTFQLQVSNDGVNWDDFGSAKSMDTIGRKMVTADTAVAATYVRVKFGLTGSGKTILRCTLHISHQ